MKMKLVNINYEPPKFLSKFLIDNNLILAGGAARSMYTGQPISDYDIYTKGEDSRPLKDVIDYLFNLKFFIAYKMLNNNITCLKTTFEDCPNGADPSIPIQLIWNNSYNKIGKIFKDFDFTVCMFAYDGRKLVATPEAIRHQREQLLCLNTIKNPVSTLERIGRYMGRGYKFTGEFGRDVLSTLTENDWTEANLYCKSDSGHGEEYES